MGRLCAVTLVAALVTVVGCSPDGAPAPESPSATSTSLSSPAATSPAPSPTDVVARAWQAPDVRVRPDRTGQDAPWVWTYSDDIVVVGPRGLVALDLETGAEVWRLPLGAPVCGATRTPSDIGLVALALGPCGKTATARRATVKVVDLESASVVWQRPFAGVPTVNSAGEVLLTVAGCRARRWDLSTGDSLGAIAPGCVDQVLAGSGVAVITSESGLRPWRVVDLASGSTLVDTTAGRRLAAPTRIIAADPLTVVATAGPGRRPSLVRVDSAGARVLAAIPADVGFASASGDSLLLAGDDWSRVTELSLEDGALVRELAPIDRDISIPIARIDGGLLTIAGSTDELRAGRGRLTLTSLVGDPVTELGDLGGLGDTDLTRAAPQAVLIEDVLLMPGPGNSGVVAYRLTLPTD